MSENEQNQGKRTGAGRMETLKLILIVGAFLVVWVLLQRVILPKMGIRT
jgi:hypothetical protein